MAKETAAPEKTPIQADYEALKRFSYRDISDKPSVYEEPGTGRTRPPKEGDTSKGSDGRSDFSTNKDAVIVYASNLLNLTTARENKEACCNLYSVMVDGKRYYFTGEVFIGEYGNVVTPYLADSLWERLYVYLVGLSYFNPVKYEGFMHSHPYSSSSESFSNPDSVVAFLSGDIYLTTQSGRIKKLTAKEAWDSKFSNPPSKSYNGLSSIDTTYVRNINEGYIPNDNDVIVAQVKQRYDEELSSFLELLLQGMIEASEDRYEKLSEEGKRYDYNK